nr:ulp1 protease family, C-terminal catalytic domain-containing protein [Tanacetum cinerariifolium]
MEIVPDDGDEVLIKATPLSSRSPTIIDYKIHKEGKKNYFKIIRADGDLFGENLARMELLNQGPLTPENIPTRVSNVSLSPKKRDVKPSSYLLSPYMNKKTKVVPKITRLEFILRNSLFAMQGDKIENIFKAHSGKFSVFGIRLNLETLAPGLWIDANVIDCWGAILNHEERFRDAKSKSRHFFPTGCITKSMFDGTLVYDDAKWESFSNQVKAQFSGYEGGLALEGIDLKKPLAHHLKFYGHNRIVGLLRMLDLANEFDKLDFDEKMSIIVIISNYPGKKSEQEQFS